MTAPGNPQAVPTTALLSSLATPQPGLASTLVGAGLPLSDSVAAVLTEGACHAAVHTQGSPSHTTHAPAPPSAVATAQANLMSALQVLSSHASGESPSLPPTLMASLATASQQGEGMPALQQAILLQLLQRVLASGADSSGAVAPSVALEALPEAPPLQLVLPLPPQSHAVGAGPGRWGGINLWRSVESILQPHGAAGQSIKEITEQLQEHFYAPGVTVNVGSLRNTLCQHKNVFSRVGPGQWSLVSIVGGGGAERTPRGAAKAAGSSRKPRSKKARTAVGAPEGAVSVNEYGVSGGVEAVEPAGDVGEEPEARFGADAGDTEAPQL